jgi:hypothetical protein
MLLPPAETLDYVAKGPACASGTAQQGGQILFTEAS